MVPTLPVARGAGGERRGGRVSAISPAGQALLDRTLAMLESQFAFLKRVEFHAEMGKKIAAFTG